jgi:outer membrane protein TolC
LPSELITRRPDIRRDYYALCAADRDLASAVSAQYPRLSFGTSLTNIAEDPSDLFRDWFLSIGSQLIAPLLDGGQRRAEVTRACAVKKELFNRYANSVLIAFGEVEDSLAREKYQVQRIKHLEEQVRLAGRASDQLRDQYLIGDAEYLDVLSAITGQQSLQRQLLSAQLELRLIRVSLYLSLAGGFDPTCQLPQEFVDSNGITIQNDQPETGPLEPIAAEETNGNQDSDE